MISPEKSRTTSINTWHVSGKVGSIMNSRCFFLRVDVIFTKIPGFQIFSPCNNIAHIAHFWKARLVENPTANRVHGSTKIWRFRGHPANSLSAGLSRARCLVLYTRFAVWSVHNVCTWAKLAALLSPAQRTTNAAWDLRMPHLLVVILMTVNIHVWILGSRLSGFFNTIVRWTGRSLSPSS